MAFQTQTFNVSYLKITKSLYTHCSDCQESLLNKLHHVEQFYGRLSLDEDLKLIFGYAICGDCRDRQLKNFYKNTSEY